MSIELMKQALEALEYHQKQTRPIHKTQETIATLRQAIAEAEKQELVPESWMGITDNPYCNDADCNDPNGRAMRWHNKLLDLRKPKNELDIAERAYFAGKKDGIDETIALIRSKNT
jgi:hypothetical protein